MARVMFWVGFCFIVAVAGCRGDGLHLSANVQRPSRAVVVFFVDGMDQTRKQELLDDGDLPNIRRRFVEGGVEARTIVCVPSITYPNTAALLTGCFPSRHGILGNSWFDPAEVRLRDYRSYSTYQLSNIDLRVPTVFETLDDHFTVSVHCHTRRGATLSINHRILNGLDFLFEDFISIDRRTGRSIGRIASEAQRRGRWPSLIWLYFPGVDEIGHEEGVHSSEYREAMQNVDTQIGRVWDAMESADLADNTTFILVTDHGHAPTSEDRVLEMDRWLRRHRGLRTLRVDREEDFEEDDSVTRYDAIALIGADRSCALHLRTRDGWGDASREEIEALIFGDADSDSLLDHPAIGLVCSRAGTNSVRILAARGQALAERRIRDGVAEYRLVVPAQGVDPLGYQASDALRAFVAQGWHSSREWLRMTANERYPDFVPQICEVFRSPRSGDLMLFASDEWSFFDEGASGHGAALARDMRVSTYFAGPGIPAGGRLDAARIVDITPTILDFLGESARLLEQPPTDGISLAPELRRAPSR